MGAGGAGRPSIPRAQGRGGGHGLCEDMRSKHRQGAEPW